jgi:hypothetical protein
MQEIIIGIPIYKKKLNKFEIISLQQVKKFLHKYPIAFIAPESFEFNYGKEYNGFFIERFPDKYFINTYSYSQLLLSIKFYERFRKYRYLLIYQLDAFVFSDKLMEFCGLGYDYIGAPIPRICWSGMKGFVGNGGLSLRKIESCIRVLKEINPYEILALLTKNLQEAEDCFFGYCGANPVIKFYVPNIHVAMEFAIDREIMHCYRNLKDRLPFGCHGWYKMDYLIWKPIIESYGYQTPELNEAELIPFKKHIIKKYLIKRLLREKIVNDRLCSIAKNIFGLSIYSIWGWGEYGKECYSFLRAIGVDVGDIYDKILPQINIPQGIQIRYPSLKIMKKHRITLLITPQKYEMKIGYELEKNGFIKNIDFLFWSGVKDQIIKAYYCQLYNADCQSDIT